MKRAEFVERLAFFRKKLNRNIKNVKVYRVGGAVRDEIMGKNPKDIDYLITGITQKELEEIYPEAKLVGADFPVYLMDIDGDRETEVALARTERKIGEGYSGFETTTDIHLTVKDDLIRRDLTINAIAIDLETNELVDPFNGAEDIKKGIIRAVSDAFSEDPLRIYRAARFAARYQFSIDESTLKLMKKIEKELDAVSGERIHLELSKVIKDRHTSLFFYWLKKAEIKGHFILFFSLKEKNKKKFKSLMQQIDRLKTDDDMIRYAVLFRYFTEGEVNHLIDVYKMPREYKQLVQFVLQFQSTIGNLKNASMEEELELMDTLIRHPLTKQAESLEKGNPYEWFERTTKALFPAFDEKHLCSFLKTAEEVKKVTVTEEELKERNIQGKEIGMFLREKRMKTLKEKKSLPNG